MIEDRIAKAVMFWCPACGHRWSADEAERRNSNKTGSARRDLWQHSIRSSPCRDPVGRTAETDQGALNMAMSGLRRPSVFLSALWVVGMSGLLLLFEPVPNWDEFLLIAVGPVAFLWGVTWVQNYRNRPN